MHKIGTAKEAGWKYLLLSLGAFLGLATEAIHAYGWEPLVFGQMSFGDYAPWQSILHWVITCFIWLGVAYLLVRVAKSWLGFDVFAKSDKMKRWQLFAALFGILLSLAGFLFGAAYLLANRDI